MANGARPRTDLRIEDIMCLVDTREKCPLDLTPLRSQRGTLPTADYTIAGLEHEVAVERKSLPDLVMCVGQERDRFEREVQRLLAYPARLLIIEASMTQIEYGGWRGKITPAQVQGSILGWCAQGLPILLVQDHAAAGRAVSRFLFVAARRRWRELQSLIPHLKIAGGE